MKRIPKPADPVVIITETLRQELGLPLNEARRAALIVVRRFEHYNVALVSPRWEADKVVVPTVPPKLQ